MRRNFCSVGIGVLALFALGTQTSAAAEAAETPTFAKDVAPILYESCVSCHRPGEVAPMSLLTYSETRPWARAIKTKVVSREMPPWHAEAGVGLKFENDRRLSQDAISTIVAWVDGGAPRGNDADLPQPPALTEGWQHPEGRTPDFIVPIPVEYNLPADGGIPYVDFFAKMPLEEDAYAEAVETRPGNRAAVHHITVNPVDMPQPPPPGPIFSAVGRTSGNGGEEAQTNQASQNALLGLFTPGQGFEQFPPGYGMKVKGGPTTYLMFNMHYQLTGRPETDRSSFAVWLHKEPVQYVMRRTGGVEGTLLAEGVEIVDGDPGLKATGTYAVLPTIPAGADNFQVVGVTPFAKDTIIYSFNPHAHLRGKDFTYNLIYPDGRDQLLLSVPDYDFNWQLIYKLEEPFVAPAGSKLVMTGHYDNSTKNRYNPAPHRDVLWAEQSWEEMFIPFVMFADPAEDPAVKDSTQDNQN